MPIDPWSRQFAVLAPMPSEFRPLVRPLGLRRAPGDAEWLWQGMIGRARIVAAMTGIGTRRAKMAVGRLLDAVAVDHVIVVGVAGGIGPSVAVGDVIIPQEVLDRSSGAVYTPTPIGGLPARGRLATGDALVSDPQLAAELERQGVIAVDMETAAVAAACESRGCPWSVLRAISDRADDGSTDAAIFGLAGPDGRPDFGAVGRLILRHPGRIPQLIVLGRGLSQATRAAAQTAMLALAQLAQGETDGAARP